MSENTNTDAKVADRGLLAQLHNLLAQDMLSRLQAGDLKATDWVAISKFLKDNGVDALTVDTAPNEDAFEALFSAAQKSIEDKVRHG